jgi:hypothetical protein
LIGVIVFGAFKIKLTKKIPEEGGKDFFGLKETPKSFNFIKN